MRRAAPRSRGITVKSSIFVLGAATFAVAAPAYAETSESDAAGESDRTIIVTGQHASTEAKRRDNQR